MRQLCQQIGLIHELAQLAASKKLLDGCGYRANIDEIARRCHIHILDAHAFAHHSL